LPEHAIEALSCAVGLGIVGGSVLEVDTLGLPPGLDLIVDIFRAVVTADGLDEGGSWVVTALVLQILADTHESFWYMVLAF
jgi:hypothetical protein